MRNRQPHMTTAVSTYDHLVNGHGYRAIELAFGRIARPRIDANALQPPSSSPLVLHIEPYAAKPFLPVDSAALDPILHVLVHGSIATADACGFSDVDIAVIVEDRRSFSAEQHAKAVAGLRHLLGSIFSYDNLMHHGLMFFPASGLLAYDQSFLPVETLRLARVLHGPRELSLWEVPAEQSRFAASLLLSAKSLRKRFSNRDFLANDFLFKQVLSGTLLMPSRVLAARGVHVYKRDSFATAQEDFNNRSWELIARAEALRSSWVRPRASLAERAIPSFAHPYLRNIVHQRFAPALNTRRLSERMICGMEKSAHAFLDRVESMA